MYEKILAGITPGRVERADIKRLCRRVTGEITRLGYRAEVMGSIAKDTWIAGNRDVDVFVFFGPEVPLERMEKEALALGKKVVRKLGGKFEIAYAQHPYVRGFVDGAKVDIVPCYKLERLRVKSAVDRTPFHVKYVNRKLKRRGDVRLLKQFLKANGLYGAELKVEGISGYLCELLVIRYGSFDGVLKNARKWAFGQVIDIEHQYKDAKLARARFNSHLVVIDPVDANRNVAASLSLANFERFTGLCAAFLSAGKKERELFFTPKKVELMPFSAVSGKLANYVVVEFGRPDVVEDILYPQMRKTLAGIAGRLSAEGFKALRMEVFAGEKCYLVLEAGSLSLPKMKKHFGPPVKMAAHAEKFRAKYPQAREESGVLVADVERKWPDAVPLVKELLKEGGVLASHILEEKKSIKAYPGKGIGKVYKGELAVFLSGMLEGTGRSGAAE